MINSIYILDKKGRVLFVRNFTQSQSNEELISGFLSMIHSFAKEISHGEEISNINLKDNKIFYKILDNLIICLIAPKKPNVKVIKNFLKKLLEYIDASDTSNLNSDFFANFRDYLDRVLELFIVNW